MNPTLMKIQQKKRPKEFLIDVDNACPEVIYECYGIFAESYYKYTDYEMDDQLRHKEFESSGKHYSQCHEFANWQLMNSWSHGAIPKRANKTDEKDLEDYLTKNIRMIERGLTFQDRQVLLPTGRVDVIAIDSEGNKVFIELKTKPLNPGDVHKLCGQVSTYYNRIQSEDQSARFFIVVLKDGIADHNYKIWYGLKHWIDQGKVKIFQFERNNGTYCFFQMNYIA